MKKTFTLLVILLAVACFIPAFSNDAPQSHSEKIKSIMVRHGLMPQPITDNQAMNQVQTRYLQSGRNEEPLIYQVLTKVWLNDSWVNSELETHSYNEDDNLLLIVLQSWENDAWNNSYQLEYVYDQEGQLIQNIYSMWDAEAGAWQLFGRSTPTFDPVTNFVTQILVEMYFEPFGWINAAVSYFTYNAQDLVSLYIEDNWNLEIMDWEHLSRTYYTYNGEELLTEELLQYWVEDQYQDGDLTTYTYNGQGQLVQRLYEYFGFTREWLPGSRTTYSYDSDGLQSHELEEMYTIDSWQNSYQITYSYDANDNLVTALRQDWASGRSWQNSSETTYTYTTSVDIAEPHSADAPVSVYPNPASGIIHFASQDELKGDVVITIVDMKGSLVARLEIAGHDSGPISWLIPAELNDGIYLYRVEAAGESVAGQLLIRR